MKIELSTEEVEMLGDFLKYSLRCCPIESISDKIGLSEDRIQELIKKLEKVEKEG